MLKRKFSHFNYRITKNYPYVASVVEVTFDYKGQSITRYVVVKNNNNLSRNKIISLARKRIRVEKRRGLRKYSELYINSDIKPIEPNIDASYLAPQNNKKNIGGKIAIGLLSATVVGLTFGLVLSLMNKGPAPSDDYTVYIDSNGGGLQIKGETKESYSYKVKKGDNLAKSLEAEEDKFVIVYPEWATNFTYEYFNKEEWIEIDQDYTVNSDTYVRLAFDSIKKATVTFNVEGATVEGQTVEYGQKITKPANPVREGYSFEGWYKESTFTTEFDFDTKLEDDDFAESITLYGKWSDLQSVTLYINANGGTCSSASTTIQYGKTYKDIKSSLPTCTRLGFDDSNSYSLTSTGTEIEDTYVFKSDVIIYAIWEPEIKKATVTFKVDDEIYGTTQTVEYGQKITRPNDPSKPNYTFEGWYIDNPDNLWDFDTKLEDDFFNETITLNASFSVSKKTVVFNDPYNSDSTKRTITYTVDADTQIGEGTDYPIPTPSRRPSTKNNRWVWTGEWDNEIETIVTKDMTYNPVYEIDNQFNFSFSSDTYTINGSDSLYLTINWGNLFVVQFDSEYPAADDLSLKLDGEDAPAGSYEYDAATGVLKIDLSNETVQQNYLTCHDIVLSTN